MIVKAFIKHQERGGGGCERVLCPFAQSALVGNPTMQFVTDPRKGKSTPPPIFKRGQLRQPTAVLDQDGPDLIAPNEYLYRELASRWTCVRLDFTSSFRSNLRPRA